MKKSWFVLVPIMLLALLLAPLAQATVATTGNEPVPQPKVISTIGSQPVPSPKVISTTGNQLVPPEPLTKKDIAKIVAAENKELLKAKDSKTATAVKEKLDGLSKKGGALYNLEEKLDRNPEKVVEGLTAKDGPLDKLGKQVDKSSYRTIGFMAGGFVIILLAIALVAFAASRRFGAAHTDIEAVVKAVDGSPERVADALGKPKNANLVFKVTDKVLYEVTHFVTRRGGSYPSLFVMEDGASRKFYEKPWEARDSSKSVMRSYFFGDLRVRQDPQALAQVKLIAALEAVGRKPPEERDKAQEWIAIRVLTC